MRSLGNRVLLLLPTSSETRRGFWVPHTLESSPTNQTPPLESPSFSTGYGFLDTSGSRTVDGESRDPFLDDVPSPTVITGTHVSRPLKEGKEHVCLEGERKRSTESRQVRRHTTWKLPGERRTLLYVLGGPDDEEGSRCFDLNTSLSNVITIIIVLQPLLDYTSRLVTL